MYVWTGAARTREPSPLLSHLAGEFAGRIAAVWPAPHADFLAAPADRRHLACLVLATGRALAPQAVTVLAAPLRQAVRLTLPDAPAGLVRALQRLGETAWTAEDYRLLLTLLGAPHVFKMLRHAGQIDIGDVRALATLPQPLLDAGIGRLRLNGQQSTLVREAFDAIVARDGEAVADRLTRRWGACGSVSALFDALRDDMVPEVATPPFPGMARLRPLATKAALRDAAVRYANCLRGSTGEAADGTSAFYEWTGTPGAVVEIYRDRLLGWRLYEARLARNAQLPDAMRRELIGELRAMGVNVGRSYWDFEHAACRATRPDFVFEPRAEAIGNRFGDDD